MSIQSFISEKNTDKTIYRYANKVKDGSRAMALKMG